MRLKLFAALRETIGQDEIDIDFGAGLTKQQFIKKFCELYPELNSIGEEFKLSADYIYLLDNDKIEPQTNELALFTSVNGG